MNIWTDRRRWGRIFTIKNIYYLGFSKYLNDDYDVNWDIETENKIPNYTYNHNFYRDGYRYLGLPIGASIDADSELNLISFRDVRKNLFIKLRYFKGKINKNNSEFNYISNSSQNWGSFIWFQNIFNDKILITTRLNLFDGFIDSDSSLFIKLNINFNEYFFVDNLFRFRAILYILVLITLELMSFLFYRFFGFEIFLNVQKFYTHSTLHWSPYSLNFYWFVIQKF